MRVLRAASARYSRISGPTVDIGAVGFQYPALSTASLPAGTLGSASQQGITATGDGAPFRYAVTGGALPPGLHLSPGASVTFAAPSGSGASADLTGSPATTGADGQASVTAAANTHAGTYTVTAWVSGVTTPASFSLTNNPGTPTSVTVSSGSGQSAGVGTAFAHSLVALVEDQYQNPVPGVSVTFAAPSTGASASLGSLTATTDANGLASVSATANTHAGTYTVTASISGVTTPASFTLTNAYRVVAQFNQSRPITSGSTVPIMIQLTNGLGQNLGSSRLAVTAVAVVGPSGPVPPQSPGNSQPGNLFTFDSGTYQFNLSTKGYAPGKYTLEFKVANDPTLYSVTFMVG
jgi:hypothetical protein